MILWIVYTGVTDNCTIEKNGLKGFAEFAQNSQKWRAEFAISLAQKSDVPSLRLLKMHCDQRLRASIGLQNTDVSRCQCCRYSRALCGGSKLVGRESRDAGLCVDFNQHVADVVRACIMHTRALRHI